MLHPMRSAFFIRLNEDRHRSGSFNPDDQEDFENEDFENEENVMLIVRRQFLSLAGAAIATAAIPRTAAAQAYPARPVRMIVPYAPGSAIDVFARLIAQRLSEHLGKQFYVENIAGAGGNIGMGRAAQAAPDGYALLFVGLTFAVNPALYEKVPYDPYRSFDPVTLTGNTTVVLAVNPSV